MITRHVMLASVLCGLACVATNADAQTAAERCRASKLQATGKLALCRMGILASFSPQPDPPNAKLGKCDTKFLETFGKIEAKGGCAIAGDGPEILDQAHIDLNKILNTLGEVPSPLWHRYVDNGDGTITDYLTGLQWEMKTGTLGSYADCATIGACSDVHDVNNRYHWTSVAGAAAPNGTVFTDFLGRLNGAADGVCFAGHCDWRLPTKDELKSILIEPYPCGVHPCIDASFGPTAWSSPQVDDAMYWSANSWSDASWKAYYASFYDGGVTYTDVPGAKATADHVRAVRRRSDVP